MKRWFNAPVFLFFCVPCFFSLSVYFSERVSLDERNHVRTIKIYPLHTIQFLYLVFCRLQVLCTMERTREKKDLLVVHWGNVREGGCWEGLIWFAVCDFVFGGVGLGIEREIRKSGRELENMKIYTTVLAQLLASPP
jgi:hypothetical protein